MSKVKRLYVLLGVLAAVCIAAFAVSRAETKKEDIRVSGETVFSLDAESVTAISWYDGSGSLAFTKSDSGEWSYDGDEAFPVDADKINERLALFESFNAAFTIENADSLSQYGLDDPECTVKLTTAEGTISVTIGAFSEMDAQRYVCFGGDTVYLAAKDPLELFSTELARMIKNDTTPKLSEVDAISFSGEQNYTLRRDESAKSLCESDVYFVDDKPLDTDRVESYLRAISSLTLNEYATYDLAEDKLSFYGLDEPTLAVTLSYTDENGVEQSFSLTVGQNKSELEIAEKNGEDTSEVQAYARVGDSSIVYELSSVDFAAIRAAGYDALRHKELFTGDFADVTALRFTLDGEEYYFEYSADENEDKLFASKEKSWRYDNGAVDEDAMSDIENALCSLGAESFTADKPDGKKELEVTVYTANEDFPQLTLALYRHDGSRCVALVDGEVTAFVARADMTELAEAVYAVVLGATDSEGELTE